jgi:hypothetical protein
MIPVADDFASIRARMEELAKARQAILSAPPEDKAPTVNPDDWVVVWHEAIMVGFFSPEDYAKLSPPHGMRAIDVPEPGWAIGQFRTPGKDGGPDRPARHVELKMVDA